MNESVAVAKEADAKKGVSPTKSDNSIHRVRNESERQLGSLRDVIGNIRRDGGTPSIESIATELSGMHTAQRTPALLALQQTHGNRYVQRVVAGIQAKLKVGQPGDVYEQEADRVADAVMRMPDPRVQRQVEPEEEKEETLQSKPLANQITSFVHVQRQEEPEEEEEEEMLQAKPLAEEITPLVLRQVEPEEGEEELQARAKATSGHLSEVTPNFESNILSLRGGGQPLPKSERAYFEPRFGQDFSQVRVHTDTRAAESARAVNARAFTVGQDVVFGSGHYASGTSEGQRLMAHELTHVVQQNVGLTLFSKGKNSKSKITSSQELSNVPPEFQAAADQEVAGMTPAPLLLALAGLIQRETREYAPDAGVPAPDAGVDAPDAGVDAPDAGVPAPDAGVPRDESLPGGVPAEEETPQQVRTPTVTGGSIWRDCGRDTTSRYRSSGFTGDTSGTYISHIKVGIHPNTYSNATLIWANRSLSSGRLQTGFNTSPGAGLCTKDCSIQEDSEAPGSYCTPIGNFTVQGFGCSFSRTATFVTWFHFARQIAFHYSSDVLDYPASHGCVRLPLDGSAAEWIYDNALPGITSVTVARDASGGPGPRCFRNWRRLILRPPPIDTAPPTN
jgi:hypothetical protein